eukprot:198551_1
MDAANPKTITTLGSIFLFVNNTVGPGMMLLPAMFQQSGWIPSGLSILLLCFMSYLIGIMLTYSIRKLPHNTNDNLRIEYIDLISYYIGNGTHGFLSNILIRICQIIYIFFMLSLLMGAIIQTCQTVDLLIAKITGFSCGIIYFPFHDTQFIWANSITSITPFNFPSDEYVLSIGTIIVYLLIIPFCLKDLQEAIWIQYVGGYGSILLIILWCIILSFSNEISTDNVPIATTSLYTVLSINFYNVAYICAYPSWLNEKQRNVSTRTVCLYTCIITTFSFLLIGYFGGVAFNPYYMTSADLLSKLNSFTPNNKNMNFLKWVAPISAYFYPPLQNATSIPPFCSIIRYNLINANISTSKLTANIITIFLPFSLSIILYQGNGFNNLTNWTGLLFASVINFILPIFFYYKSLVITDETWHAISMTKFHKNILLRSNMNVYDDDDDNSMNSEEYVAAGQSKKKKKNGSIETDSLLKDNIQKIYNTNDNNIKRIKTSNEAIDINVGITHILCKANKSLFFLIITIFLAIFAFAMDIISIA